MREEPCLEYKLQVIGPIDDNLVSINRGQNAEIRKLATQVVNPMPSLSKNNRTIGQAIECIGRTADEAWVGQVIVTVEHQNTLTNGQLGQ